jgi:hypothetical protein
MGGHTAAQPPPAEAAATADGDSDMAEPESDAGRAEAADDAHGMDAKEGDEPGTSGKPGPRPQYTDKLTVFVKGLRTSVQDAEVDALFKELVPDGIKDIRIMRDSQTGQARVGKAGRAGVLHVAGAREPPRPSRSSGTPSPSLCTPGRAI